MFDSPSHWLVVIILFAALFGYKKLPDVTRSVARSLRIFKTEMKGMSEDDAARNAATGPSASPYGANPYAATPPAEVPAPAPPAAVNPSTADQPTPAAAPNIVPPSAG